MKKKREKKIFEFKRNCSESREDERKGKRSKFRGFLLGFFLIWFEW